MPKNNEYFIEFVPQGRFVKVCAVDPVTGVEAIIVGDARESQAVLTRNAVNKLEYMIKKTSPQS